jgi:hypothetical protein
MQYANLSQRIMQDRWLIMSRGQVGVLICETDTTPPLQTQQFLPFPRDVGF